VARVTGDFVSTRGRELDAASVGPSEDVFPSPAVEPTRPRGLGLLGGVPDAEEGCPRRGDLLGDGIASHIESRASDASKSAPSARPMNSSFKTQQRKLGAGTAAVL
jgi:hypothetical protein